MTPIDLAWWIIYGVEYAIHQGVYELAKAWC